MTRRCTRKTRTSSRNIAQATVAEFESYQRGQALILVQDMVDMLTSMCARRYGRRSARKRADAAVKAAEVTG